MFSYAVPPIVALFVLGVFWRRANASGGAACMVVGLALGIGGFLAIEVFGLFSLHFLYMAPLLFLACCIALVLGSLRAPPPDPSTVDEYIWSPSLFAAESAELAAKPAWQNYRYQALTLLLVTTAIVVAFR
jgi:SSS family solute:Na+ symporter